MKEKYLPVGSVVRLKGQKRPIVIVGYGAYNQEESTKKALIYDYTGFPYPEGFIGEGKNIAFNHNLIEEIKFEGYTTDDFNGLTKEIDEAIEKFREENQ